jgi:hypothetical protein
MDCKYYNSVVNFKFSSLGILLAGYTALLAYYLRVIYIIRQRLLPTLTVIWSFFCATIVF